MAQQLRASRTGRKQSDLRLLIRSTAETYPDTLSKFFVPCRMILTGPTLSGKTRSGLPHNKRTGLRSGSQLEMRNYTSGGLPRNREYPHDLYKFVVPCKIAALGPSMTAKSTYEDTRPVQIQINLFFSIAAS